ncbi:MAG TPA: YbhB/YbcL family Raf kinase inhibitor-like protein [Tepidisphaeraceae bacterium]|nr:YbhB/YbcL family Raf kinase inhibitor-like protein [Tepidisphaeraceae bacterium]
MNIGDTIKSAVKGIPTLLTGGQPGYRAGEEKLSWFHPDLTGPQAINVKSTAFADGDSIPLKYSVDGENISPSLEWSGLPAGTRSVVLVVEDPDAPTPEPFVHWLLYNIPPTVTSVPQGASGSATGDRAAGAMQGKNSNLKTGWTGMAPPKGDTPHRYFFQLFALDAELSLEPGAGRSALFEAMGGHVLGRGRIVGTYQR